MDLRQDPRLSGQRGTGAALTKHEDGEGFNLLLQAMPLDGKIVLRTYKEREEEQKEVNSKGKYKK